MGMRCDLHAIDHDLRIELTIRKDKRLFHDGGAYVIVELGVGGGLVSLFLNRTQATQLSLDLGACVSNLYGDRGQPGPFESAKEGEG